MERFAVAAGTESDAKVEAVMRVPAAVVVLAVLALSGCAGGSLSGAADQALPRSLGFAANEPLAGIVGGGLVSQSGAELSRRARVAAVEAEYRALESTPAGQPVTWRDEEAGLSGMVTAAQPYRVGSQDCRPYSHVVNAGGDPRSLRGTACRNPDGSWTLLN